MTETLSFNDRLVAIMFFYLNNNNRSETIGLYCMRGSSKLSLHMCSLKKEILALSEDIISPNQQKSDEHRITVRFTIILF